MDELLIDTAAAHAEAGTDPAADLAALEALADPAVARLFADMLKDADGKPDAA